MKSTLKELYPPIEPFISGHLKVSNIHSIYFEVSGNPDGKPVVFLHGGPGGATNPKYRSFFDPKKYKIVLFDQRGCGESKPFACLEDNTTWNLIGDIEEIRQHLNISKWQVFGGSWGAALALAYAQQKPNCVSELVLRGIFTLRQSELDWFYKSGADNIFPDAWDEYISLVPENERHRPIEFYYSMLTSESQHIQEKAAKAWTRWEKSTCRLVPDTATIKAADDLQYAIAFSRIECHYFVNNGFFSPETQLLDNLERIRHIPCVVVQGRYDIVCPMTTAWTLHKRWPEAELRLLPTAGHSCFEQTTIHELVDATDRFASA